MNSQRRNADTTVLLGLLAVVSSLFLTGELRAEDEARISMTMKNAELADVMDMIAREQRVNIFVSTESAEAVSFSIYDLTLPEAIRSIASAAGFAVEEDNGSYFVVDRDEAGRYAADVLTHVKAYDLQYARVDDIESLLSPYLSEYGAVTTMAERNLFLVEDTPQFQQRIAAIVEHIDKPPTQVLIEAQILEITLTDEDSFGLDWSKFFDSEGGTGSFGTQGLSSPTSPGLFLDYVTPDVSASLDALTSQGRVRTLSSPKLLATENEEASVIIGDRRGYAVTTTINQVTTESIEFLESGVILRVTAAVDGDSQVMMLIHPEVSSGVIDPITGIPSQTTTEVTTRMIVPSGETVFVGGLIKHRVDESKRGVPIVGRIPGVGRLFSNRQKSVTNTETIVLIKPTIVAGFQAADPAQLDRIDEIESESATHSENINDEMVLFFGGAN